MWLKGPSPWREVIIILGAVASTKFVGAQEFPSTRAPFAPAFQPVFNVGPVEPPIAPVVPPEPTAWPTETTFPSPSPSDIASSEPTTGMPSARPTETAVPSPAPSIRITSNPTAMPTETVFPSPSPSDVTTSEPTEETEAPSPSPTSKVTTSRPTIETEAPTFADTIAEPTVAPSTVTLGPTTTAMTPTFEPSASSDETFSPTYAPILATISPATPFPSPNSSIEPSIGASETPSWRPSDETLSPTPHPTNDPSHRPTEAPTTTPPTAFPTFESDIDYFDNPKEKWALSLNNFLSTNMLTKGNSVSVSPDGVLIYVTRDKGRLDVHSAIDGSFRYTYTPTRVGPSFSPVQCQSGIVFAELDDMQFALYSIIDMPTVTADGSSDGLEASSRIIAIAHPFNEVIFVSEQLPGIVVGTPVVTIGSFPGRYIFVTHNTNTLLTTLPSTGHFSVLDMAQNGAVIFTESVVDVAPDTTFPYGPLGVSHNPTGGNYDSGESNTNDLVAWTSSVDGGTGGAGFIRGFQLPVGFQPDSADSLNTVSFRDVGWNAIAHPTFSEDGQDLFIGIRQSRVRGWADDSTFNTGATWSDGVARDDEDPGTPIQNAPTLSKSGNILFVTPAGNAMAAINAHSGERLWQVETDDTFTSEVKLSPDNQRVYMLSAGGIVESRDSRDGGLLWKFHCNRSEGNVIPCERNAQAEFSLSPDGLTLYFGDIDGNLRALSVGSSIEPTPQLTEFPSRAPVTSAPTTVQPSVSAPPSLWPSAALTLTPTFLGETRLPSSAPSVAPTSPTDQPTESSNPSVLGPPVFEGSSEPSLASATQSPTSPPNLSGGFALSCSASIAFMLVTLGLL